MNSLYNPSMNVGLLITCFSPEISDSASLNFSVLHGEYKFK